MHLSRLFRTLSASTILLASLSAEASPVTVNFSASIGTGDIVFGYAGVFAVGDTIQGTYVYDADEANASGAIKAVNQSRA